MNKMKMLALFFVLSLLAALAAYKDLFIAATVNGLPLSRWSVIEELEKNSGQQALDILITKKLIEAETAKAGIEVTEADLEAEMKSIEDEIAKQGATLESALAQQGISLEQFREQLTLQKELEQILADRIRISDEEVTAYLEQSKALQPAGVSEEDFRNQIREQLKNQKFNAEADKWITALKSEADIRYYVDYGKPAPLPLPASSSAESQ